MRDKGHTILFSTHNMASVEEICDNIALINHSKVVLQGEVNDVRQRYKENTYRIVIPADKTLPESVEVLSCEEQMGHKVLLVRKPQDESPSAFIIRLAKETDILEFSEQLPSMNDVFIRVVKEDELR